MSNTTKKSNIKIKIITAVIAVIILLLAVLVIVCLTNKDPKQNFNPIATVTNKDPGYNFIEIRKTNPDAVGWIIVPGTTVDTPVVQNPNDDFYYLLRNAAKEYDPAGAAYIERKNHADFKDPVTVIYGHNMVDDRIFSKLLNYADRSFFDQNKEFYIYTPQHKYTYTVISAYVYDDRHILNSYDFSNKEVVASYFDEVTHPKSLSQNVREGASLNKDSKIVQLSTCMNDLSLTNQRYIVTGVLTNDQPTD